MIEPRADQPRPITLGADKAYDAEDFFNELRSMNATPHVTQNKWRARTTGIRFIFEPSHERGSSAASLSDCD